MFRSYRLSLVVVGLIMTAFRAYPAPKVVYTVNDEGKIPAFSSPLSFELKDDERMRVPVKNFSRACEFRSSIKGQDPRGNPANTYILSCSVDQDRVEIGVGCFGEENHTNSLTFVVKGKHHQFKISCN